MQHTFEEFIVAPLTPLNLDGSVHLERVAPYANYLCQLGATGVFINGTTGEGLSLSVKERLDLADVWRGVTANKLKLFVNISDTAVPRIHELGKHAEAIGVDAVSTIGPIYYKIADTQDFVAFCAESASVAPNTDYFYYHIPSLSNAACNASEILKLGKIKIPTLKGVKYTHSDFMDLGRICQIFGNELVAYYGFDELLLPALNYPIQGGIGSTYSFALPLYQKVIAAQLAGEAVEAFRLHSIAVNMIDVLIKYGVIPSEKAIMTELDLPMGSCRWPLKGLTPMDAESMIKEVKKTGIWEYLVRAE